MLLSMLGERILRYPS